MNQDCQGCAEKATRLHELQLKLLDLEEQSSKCGALNLPKPNQSPTTKKVLLQDFVRAAAFPFLALLVRVAYRSYFSVKKRSEK